MGHQRRYAMMNESEFDDFETEIQCEDYYEDFDDDPYQDEPYGLDWWDKWNPLP
jgi:hypothetical protein